MDCLERGATVESDIYQNIRSLLPEAMQQSLPEKPPFAPSSFTKEPTSDETKEDVTYTSLSVAEEKACTLCM